jgi:hypothetical protein
MQVEVRDQDNRLLGLGRTSPGRITYLFAACRFTFTVDDLPEARFYQLELGRRGAPTYTLTDMEQMDWCVELDLGDRMPGLVDWQPPPDCAPLGPPP